MSFSPGRLRQMKALSNKNGVIAAAAMDQRGSLQKSIAGAKGVPPADQITPAMMEEFKVAVEKVLTPHPSAILLDPEFGLPAAKARASNAGRLLAYEESGYVNMKVGLPRYPSPNVTPKRSLDWDANTVRILLYYSSVYDPKVNYMKNRFMERVRAECHANDVPFFLDFTEYDPRGGDDKRLGFAKNRSKRTTPAMQGFSNPRFGCEGLKVAVSVNAVYVEDSAVVRDPILNESLSIGAESGADYSSVRVLAAWADVVPYGKQVVEVWEEWLSNEGAKNMESVRAVIKRAKPWHLERGLPPSESVDILDIAVSDAAENAIGGSDVQF